MAGRQADKRFRPASAAGSATSADNASACTVHNPRPKRGALPANAMQLKNLRVRPSTSMTLLSVKAGTSSQMRCSNHQLGQSEGCQAGMISSCTADLVQVNRLQSIAGEYA